MYEKLFNLQEEVFKVLANQKRLEIIQLLASGELCVGDMIDMLGIAQANLSQHLALMRRAGLLKITKRGTKVYYRLADSTIADAVFSVRNFLVTNNQLGPKEQEYFNQAIELYPVVKDVVCGMRLSAVQSSYEIQHEHRQYFFCASGCRDIFRQDPVKYAHKISTLHSDNNTEKAHV